MYFSLFFAFFLVVVTLTELPALSILFAPASKGTLIVMNLLTYFLKEQKPTCHKDKQQKHLQKSLVLI